MHGRGSITVALLDFNKKKKPIRLITKVLSKSIYMNKTYIAKPDPCLSEDRAAGHQKSNCANLRYELRLPTMLSWTHSVVSTVSWTSVTSSIARPYYCAPLLCTPELYFQNRIRHRTMDNSSGGGKHDSKVKHIYIQMREYQNNKEMPFKP